MGGTVVIGGDAAGTVAEDIDFVDSGDLNQTGTLGGAQTWSIATGPAYGTVSINANGLWTYTLNNNNATVSNLNTGQTLNDTFTVRLNVAGTITTRVVTISIAGRTDPCFVKGTKIHTDRGWVRVENLNPGELVLTHDHGFVQIEWIGDVKRKLTETNAPIVFPKNCFGRGMPFETFMVSPQHLILLANLNKRIPKNFREVFVPAQFFIESELRAFFKNNLRPYIYNGNATYVHYFHILLAKHNIIFAQNVACESLNLGPISKEAFLKDTHPSDVAKIEMLASIERELCVRPVLRRNDFKVLISTLNAEHAH